MIDQELGDPVLDLSQPAQAPGLVHAVVEPGRVEEVPLVAARAADRGAAETAAAAAAIATHRL